MAEHNAQSVVLAQMMGHSPNDVYGEPVEDKTDLQKFQEEVPTVEELLAELPTDDVVEDIATDVAEDVVEDVVEEVEEDILAKLKTYLEGEIKDADKETAEELVARLEELASATENAQAFLAEKVTVMPEEGVVVEEEIVVE